MTATMIAGTAMVVSGRTAAFAKSTTAQMSSIGAKKSPEA